MKTIPYNMPRRPRSTGDLLISLLQAIIVFSLIVWATAGAGQYRVSWDAHPELSVMRFNVYKLDGAARIFLGSSTTPELQVEAAPGDSIIVTAWNGMESEPSAPVVIPAAAVPPQPPTGLRVVEIQTSSNLADWKPLAYVPLHDGSPQRFVRATITTIPQP
jgi:hypothetical protein